MPAICRARYHTAKSSLLARFDFLRSIEIAIPPASAKQYTNCGPHFAHHGVDAADHLSIVAVRFESRHWHKDGGSEPEALDSTQRAEQGEILNSMTLSL